MIVMVVVLILTLMTPTLAYCVRHTFKNHRKLRGGAVSRA
jgi:hypothetical protein